MGAETGSMLGMIIGGIVGTVVVWRAAGPIVGIITVIGFLAMLGRTLSH